MSPVRNIQSIGRTKPIPVHIWIPPTYDALYKVEVIRSDETVDDITKEIIEGEVFDGATETIGNFTFTIINSDESKTGIWTGNEIVYLYMDYATSAVTKRFRGRIEKVSYPGNVIKITGRSESVKLTNITITKIYENIETSVILKELFDEYATDFTYNNVNTSTTNVTVNWYQKPFWECVKELCSNAGFDCYIDSDLDCHYFKSGTVKNITEAVVHNSNLLEIEDFADDLSVIKNKVIVYGVEIKGLPLIKTAKDDNSINTYGRKELIINDTNITTELQCQERADYELALGLNPKRVGEVTSIGLATIQPGEQIRISAPESNLPPAFYKIISYQHKFSGFHTTTLTLEKSAQKISTIVKERMVIEKELVKIPNPFEMEYSWNFDFLTDSGTHTNTEIRDGVLKVVSGQSSGTWTSDLLELDNWLAKVESRINGSGLARTKIWVSVDGGATFIQLGGPGSRDETFASGRNIKMRVDLAQSNSEVNGLALLYSLR